MKVKFVFSIAYAFFGFLVTPLLSQNSEEKFSSPSISTPFQRINYFFDETKVDQLNLIISTNDSGKQQKAARFLIQNLDSIPYKVEIFGQVCTSLKEKINSSTDKDMVLHSLYVTAITGVYTRFENNIKAAAENIKVSLQSHQLNIWREIEAQIQHFIPKNLNQDFMDDSWLGTLGEMITEQLGIEPIHFNNGDENNFLSNFYAGAPFEIRWQQEEDYKSILFKTSEHFFQANKFLFNSEDFDNVLACPTAEKAKKYTEENQSKMRDDWEQLVTEPFELFNPGHYNSTLSHLRVKDDAMIQALYFKFIDTPWLADKLLETGYRAIVANNETDGYWGHSLQDMNCSTSKNMLGRLLMTLRSHIRKNPHCIPYKWQDYLTVEESIGKSIKLIFRLKETPDVDMHPNNYNLCLFFKNEKQADLTLKELQKSLIRTTNSIQYLQNETAFIKKQHVNTYKVTILNNQKEKLLKNYLEVSEDFFERFKEYYK